MNNKIGLQRVGRLGQIWGREEVFAQYPYPVLLTYALNAASMPHTAHSLTTRDTYYRSPHILHDLNYHVNSASKLCVPSSRLADPWCPWKPTLLIHLQYT